MMNRRLVLCAAVTISISLGMTLSGAEPRIRDVRTITLLPSVTTEIKKMHDAARDFSAELLPEGESPEVKSFAPFLTKLDEIEAQKRLPNTSSRRHALSVGLEMFNDDQKHLPTLSRDQILSYLNSNYVSIQARVYREPVSRTLYLGSRCLAATRTFRDGKLTQAFSPTVADSVSEMRSLGLLLPAGKSPTAVNLRTLVVVYKNQLQQENNRSAVAKTSYEYLFIRGREAGLDQLELHAFATSNDRSRLHWLKPGVSPGSPLECSVRGAIHFTEYSHQGLYPKSAVVRQTMIVGQKTFTWESLEIYAQKVLGQRVYENVTPVLDAIIAGDLAEDEFLRF